MFPQASRPAASRASDALLARGSFLSPGRVSGVHKGGFSKGGLAIYMLLLCYYC